MKIVIAGAGSVGRYMAQELLGFGHEVCLIDTEASALEKVDKSMQGLSVSWGDACDIATLEKSGIAQADVVAAVTGDDEDNLVISLLAKQEFGVPRVVARVNNPNNHWMFNEMWGVDVSVSTPHLLTALVEEAVTTGSLVRLMSFDRGNAALEEVRLAEGSPAIGKQISELQLPRDSTIVGIIRDAHVMAPSGEIVLRANDEVLVLLTGEDSENAVRQTFIS